MRDLLSTGVALWVTVFSIPVLATTFVGKSIISLPVDGSTYTVNVFDSALAAVPTPQNIFTTFSAASNAIAATVSSISHTNLITYTNTVPGTYHNDLIVPYSPPYGPAPLQHKGIARFIPAPAPAPVPETVSNAMVGLGLFGLS